jgi:hypothetical protein
MNETHRSLRSSLRLVFIVIALSLFGGIRAAFALGSDHPKQAVSASSWPKGMSNLVNSPERIHGYFVNAEDVFFFSGDQEHFDQFLRDYAKIDGVVSHKIVIHSGLGRAKSPWQKDEGLKCDWMVDGCLSSWKRGDPAAKGYILEVHIWQDGRIKLEKGRVPEGVTVERAKSTEPDGPANGSQPIRSQTNSTSSAAGSRR